MKTIGSRKATLADRRIMGCNWTIRELHGYKNRWNNARIYKTNKHARISNKENLADEINWRNDGLIIDTKYGEIIVYS